MLGTRPTANSNWSASISSQPVIVMREAAVLALLDPVDRRVELEVDALADRNLQQPVDDLLVIVAQQHVGAVDQGHVAAELVEDAGEFVGDIAAAGDDDPLRAASRDGTPRWR